MTDFPVFSSLFPRISFRGRATQGFAYSFFNLFPPPTNMNMLCSHPHGQNQRFRAFFFHLFLFSDFPVVAYTPFLLDAVPLLPFIPEPGFPLALLTKVQIYVPVASGPLEVRGAWDKRSWRDFPEEPYIPNSFFRN